MASVSEATSWSLRESKLRLSAEIVLGSARRIATIKDKDGAGRVFEVQLSDRAFSEVRHRNPVLRSVRDGTRYEVDLLRVGDAVVVLRSRQVVPDDDQVDLVVAEDASVLAGRLAAVIGGLADGSRRAGSPPLVKRILQGHLDLAPVLAVPVDGLDQAQARAVAAITADGVHAVWAPPGTGAPDVIAAAVAGLVAEGQTVLLVAPSGRLIDRSVLGIAHRLAATTGQCPPDTTDAKPDTDTRIGCPSATGVVVRVGAPADERLVGSPLLLAGAAEARCQPLLRRVADLDARLAGLDADIDLARHRHLVQLLTEADRIDLSGVAGRIGAQRAWLTAQTARDDATTALRDHEAALRVALDELASAKAAMSEAPARQWQRIDLLHQNVTYLRGRLADRREQHDYAVAQHETAEAARASTGRRWRSGQEAARRLDAAAAKRNEAASALRRAIDDVERVVRGAARQEAGIRSELPPGCDADWWRSLNRRLADASEAVTRATAARDGAARNLLAARQAAAEVRPVELSARERELADLAARLPALRRELADLGQVVRDRADERERVEAEVTDLRRELATAERAALADARVVATSLATMVSQRAVNERRYDVVIVDGASTAALPVVVAAASLARRSVALVGDFCQAGVVADPRPDPERCQTPLPSPPARHCLVSDPFTHLGLRSRHDAGSDPGCVSIGVQDRFGPSVQRLLNDLAYDDALTLRAGWSDPVGDGRGELVLIDTDPLPKRAQWIGGGTSARWTAGLALTSRLVAAHPDRSIGIVTPYRDQADLYRALIAETGLGPRVLAGTVDAFTGVEVDVVVFDLVSSRHYTRNLIRAARGGTRRQLADLRLATVALTRSRGRVYLIGSTDPLPAVATPPAGGLFEVLADHRRRGRIEVLSATDLLVDPPGATPPGAARPGAAGDGALVEVLAGSRFRERFAQAVDRCRHRVEIWSPVVGIGGGIGIGPADRTGHDGLVAAWDQVLGRDDVAVTVVTRPPRSDTPAPILETLAALRDRGVELRQVPDLRDRLVIVDGEHAFWGGVDPLAPIWLGSSLHEPPAHEPGWGGLMVERRSIGLSRLLRRGVEPGEPLRFPEPSRRHALPPRPISRSGRPGPLDGSAPNGRPGLPSPPEPSGRRTVGARPDTLTEQR